MPRVAITISGKSPQPYRFELSTKKVSISRSEDNDITIACPSVSSLHCTMERVDGGYILRDRHSTNGISLGDDDMAVIDLRNDSEIKVGDVKFEYSAHLRQILGGRNLPPALKNQNPLRRTVRRHKTTPVERIDVGHCGRTSFATQTQ